MAERITKVRECDRAGCRRRKGVKKVKLAMWVADENGVFPSTAHTHGLWIEGELCPFHRKMASDQQLAMFQNTKQYDEPEDNDGPEERFSE